MADALALTCPASVPAVMGLAAWVGALGGIVDGKSVIFAFTCVWVLAANTLLRAVLILLHRMRVAAPDASLSTRTMPSVSTGASLVGAPLKADSVAAEGT